MKQISEKKIHIETCSTSNVLIGFFHHYDKTPFTQLIGKPISASINTFIKGSIGISLENEYAIVKLTLEKKGTTQHDVDQHIRRMMTERYSYRFQINNIFVNHG